jgi:hypothetical protein
LTRNSIIIKQLKKTGQYNWKKHQLHQLLTNRSGHKPNTKNNKNLPIKLIRNCLKIIENWPIDLMKNPTQRIEKIDLSN